MWKKSLILSMLIFLILMLSSCATPINTETNKVLFTEFDPPPVRPTLETIPNDNLTEAIRQLGINQVKLTTTIEKWENHQDRENTYYTKVYVESP